MKSVWTALALLAIVTQCADAKMYSYNYRITVTVKDHGVVRKGLSVVGVTETTDSGRIYPPRSCGEATAVKLEDGRVFVALMSGPPPKGLFPHYQWLGTPTGALLERLGLPTEFAAGEDRGIQQLPQVHETVELFNYQLPELVLFGKAGDPTSVQRISPDRADPLAEGVQLQSISLTPTTETVTRGNIIKVLPWIQEEKTFIDGSALGQNVHRYQSISFKHC